MGREERAWHALPGSEARVTGGSGVFSNDTVTRTAANGFLYTLAESGLGHKVHPRLVWLSSADGLEPSAAGILTCFSVHGGDT